MSWRRAWRIYRSWWLDLEVSREKLFFFRVIFFALLGLDAWLQVVHAPRYGAGDFNVAHHPVFDALLPAPGRTGMLLFFLGQAYLALKICFGGASRASLVALTTLFGASYFVSQLNSYQHHYLIFLILFAACFVPFAAGTAGARRGAWAIRLILVQISIVYLWAAIAKLDPLWLDGQALAAQVRAGWVRDLVEGTLGAPLRPEHFGGWAIVAKLVIAVELALAVAIHLPRLRVPAIAVAIPFHLSIELAGFQIGLFSYFMIALYVLLLPDRWLVRARDALSRTRLAVWSRARRVATAPHLAACVGLFFLVTLHDEPALDHHRFWGGSLRRLGKMEEATRVYEEVVKRWPAYAPGHTSLGNLYRRTGDQERAIESYRRAQARAPLDDRPYLGEALSQALAGRAEEAAEAATRARWRARMGRASARERHAVETLRRVTGRPR